MIQEAKLLPGDVERLQIPSTYEVHASTVSSRTRQRLRGVLTLVKKKPGKQGAESAHHQRHTREGTSSAN